MLAVSTNLAPKFLVKKLVTSQSDKIFFKVWTNLLFLAKIGLGGSNKKLRDLKKTLPDI